MQVKDQKVLVTGSSGFVGRHLVGRLSGAGARVSCFDITDGKDITQWSDW
ncbi:MAG: NAD-dependent epimerase/dehydratase family protein, partial [Candidatus Latescibacterota bacterium]